MSSTKKFCLNPLSMQSSGSTRNALNSMRNFYHSHAAGSAAVVTRRSGHAARPIEFNSWSSERCVSRDEDNAGRLSKVVGCKKSLVNQMQQTATQPKIRAHLSTQAISPIGSKYRIYGRTKLFSSMSSLQAEHSSSSGFHGVMPQSNRCFSSVAQQVLPANSMAQKRYQNFVELHDKRNGELAKDISSSIQSELMVVDSSTKRLISCAHEKCDHTGNSQTREEKQQAHHQQRHKHKQHQKHLQQQQSSFRYDPLESYRHPRAPKASDTAKAPSDGLMKQQKPLRRKPTNIRYKDESNEPINQQFAQPKLQSRKLQAKLGELYANTTKEYNTEKRHKLCPKKPAAGRQRDSFDNKLMDMPVRHKRQESAEHEERYRQPAAEREYINRNILKSERNAELSGAAADDSGRMDDLHYQSKVAANLMSASQRVINKQYEGYRNQVGDTRSKMMLARNIVQTVNPMPLAKVPAQPPVPKIRLMALGRASGSSKTKHPQKSPMFKNDKATSKRTTPKMMPQKSLIKPGHSTLSSYKVDSERYLPNKFEKSSRSLSSGPTWNKGNSQQSQQSQQSQHPQRLSHLQVGEKREDLKPEEKTMHDNVHNNVLMPTEYTKESAVQRLGTAEKRSSHAYQIHQRTRM